MLFAIRRSELSSSENTGEKHRDVRSDTETLPEFPDEPPRVPLALSQFSQVGLPDLFDAGQMQQTLLAS